MTINELTIGEMRDLSRIFGGGSPASTSGINSMLGKKVIIRTYSAGVHFGELVEKSGSEVILKNARRLWRWKTNGGISLSEVAAAGLHEDSKVCCQVESIWMEAIEIIPCTEKAITSIEAQDVYQA